LQKISRNENSNDCVIMKLNASERPLNMQPIPSGEKLPWQGALHGNRLAVSLTQNGEPETANRRSKSIMQSTEKTNIFPSNPRYAAGSTKLPPPATDSHGRVMCASFDR
jgi:hypothetical protein